MGSYDSQRWNSRRYQYNKQILEAIEDMVELHPDWRFGQILYNLGIVDRPYGWPMDAVRDPFHEEPDITHARMLETVGGWSE